MANAGQNETVRKGLWRNHDLSVLKNTQFLVEERTAQMISNAVAITLALVLPRLVIFVKLSLPYFIKGCSKLFVLVSGVYQQVRGLVFRTPRIRRLPSPNTTPADDILLEPPRARIAAGASQTIAESLTFEGAASQIVSRHLMMRRVELPEDDNSASSFVSKYANALKNIQEDFWAFAWLSLVALLLFTLFVGQQVIAISASSIIAGNEALMTSPNCGVWLSEAYSKQLLRIGKNNLSMSLTSFAADRSLEAISYVDKCYKNDSRLEECSYYYKSKIPFKEIHNASCPFSGDICLYGSTGAYELDSGFLDSSLLGINEKHRCEFRLQSVCAPLVTGDPYVQSRPGSDDGSLIVDYYFGNVRELSYDHENLTFSWTFRRPNFNFLTTQKKQYNWEEYPLPGPGRPFSNFRAELLVSNSTTTLFFVSSQAVLFTKFSNDPIFPNVLAPASTGSTTLYWNNLQRHTMLACAETVSLRHPRSGALFFPSFSPPSLLQKPEWQNPSVADSVVLLNLSLHMPDYFPNKYSWKHMSFDVHKKAATIVASTPLEPEQWKFEARRMYMIRAARWQIDVLGTAAGSGWDLPLARNALLDYSGKAGGEKDLDVGVDIDVCRRIKFRSNGWKNVSLSGLATMLLLSGAIWVSTIELGNEKEILLLKVVRELTRVLIYPVMRWLLMFVETLKTKSRNRVRSRGLVRLQVRVPTRSSRNTRR